MVSIVENGVFGLRDSVDSLWKKKSDEKPVPQKLIQISTSIENDSPDYNNIHNIWSMIKLTVPSSSSNDTLAIDFVVVIDISASMRQDNKLAYVLATLQYFISQLHEHHRFCLILFNDQVAMATNGLLPMTKNNKDLVLERLLNIEACGSTNIGDALVTSLSVILDRDIKSQVSSIMLFSDGLSNTGLTTTEINQSLQSVPTIEGLTVNTFGFGKDHDSDMLKNIAFAANGGLYYYIESTNSIPSLFGESLVGVLSTVANNVEVEIAAYDGCRATRLITRYPTTETVPLKNYKVTIGSLSASENRALITRLSLRKMSNELSSHPLLKVTLRYHNLITGINESSESIISVSRPNVPKSCGRPFELDIQLNRIAAVVAIEKAVNLVKTLKDFTGARDILESTIQSIQCSPSALDPYCEDLMNDLTQCIAGMNERQITNAIHYANAYSSMYQSERSAGCQYLKGLINSHNKRREGYGYCSSLYVLAADCANVNANVYLNRYASHF